MPVPGKHKPALTLDLAECPVPPSLLRSISDGSNPWLLGSDVANEIKDKLLKIGRLNHGASATVHRAVDIETLAIVAIKELTCATAKARDMVQHEVAALDMQRVPLLSARVQPHTPPSAVSKEEGQWRFSEQNEEASSHAGGRAVCPHIVQYYGCSIWKTDSGEALGSKGGERGGDSSRSASGSPANNACSVIIAVEYERGGNLQHCIDKSYRWSLPWLAHISRAALLALKYVHALGRVHRDIKPANMLLNSKGDLKLADFGISRKAEAGSKTLHSMAGTLQYMSPERLRAETYSFSSDHYSLGLTLATVALGECPVPALKNEFDQLEYAEEAADRTHQLGKERGLDPDLLDFLEILLHPDPDLRATTEQCLEHRFLKEAELWPHTHDCKGLLNKFEEVHLEMCESLDPVDIIQRIVKARLDSYYLGPYDQLDLQPLANELGMGEDPLLCHLESVTRDEMASRLGPEVSRMLSPKELGPSGFGNSNEGAHASRFPLEIVGTLRQYVCSLTASQRKLLADGTPRASPENGAVTPAMSDPPSSATATCATPSWGRKASGRRKSTTPAPQHRCNNSSASNWLSNSVTKLRRGRRHTYTSSPATDNESYPEDDFPASSTCDLRDWGVPPVVRSTPATAEKPRRKRWWA
ncbi:unnamed protein product [Chrysoparadoxa australica]